MLRARVAIGWRRARSVRVRAMSTVSSPVSLPDGTVYCVGRNYVAHIKVFFVCQRINHACQPTHIWLPLRNSQAF